MFQRISKFVLFASFLALFFGVGSAAFAAPAITPTTPSAQPIVLDSDTTCPIETPCETDIITEAAKYIGIRYKFGGTTPTSGFDCSGFVRWVYQQFDLFLPRTAREQAQVGKEVPVEDLKVGDIVVFRTGRTGYHSGIYIGNDRFIHSPGTGKTIREANMKIGYFANKLITVRRLSAVPH